MVIESRKNSGRVINMSILTIYPNCSLGGMTSVYLNRCLEQPNEKFSFIFNNDKGGKNAFSALTNADTRIVRKDRILPYLKYILSTIEIKYDEIRVTSLPDLPLAIKSSSSIKVIYEFHTSSLDIITKELNGLSLESVDEIWVPSLYLKYIVSSILDNDIKVKVIRNLANSSIFNLETAPTVNFKFPSDKIPIFWIGRFDKGKNYKDFLRALSLLDDKYVGYIILSMEKEPNRYAEALGDVAIHQLTDRVKFLLNLTQQEVADLYKNAYEVGGIFCSTSLAESFGYGVLEAAMTGLPVVAYDVGALSEHLDYGYKIKMINVGDTLELANAIRDIDVERISKQIY